MEPDAIKFMYLPDPEIPERVVTLARQVADDGKLRVSWCINRVREEEYDEPNPNSTTGGTIHTYRLIVDDVFCKWTARAITCGRLASDREGRWIAIDVPKGEPNLQAMLQGVIDSEDVPWFVRDVVLRSVQEREEAMREKATDKADHVIASMEASS
jgi:hypothetical protein